MWLGHSVSGEARCTGFWENRIEPDDARARVFRARCAACGPETSRKARRGDAQQSTACSEQCGGLGDAMRDDPDELISRIEDLLDDDEPLDDWQYPWSDSMRWAPAGVELPSGCWDDQAEEELDSGWDYYPPAEIHVIPAHQVDEWLACLDTMPPAERGDIDWYVVCHEHKVAGEREVDCRCGRAG